MDIDEVLGGVKSEFGGKRGGERRRMACQMAIGLLAMAGTALPHALHGADIQGRAPDVRDPHKHVLILHSYHQGYRLTDNEMAGMNAVLRPEAAWLESHVVYMDAKRVSHQEHGENLYRLLRTQLAQIPLDAVLAADNDALAFALRHRPALFPGRPIVFCAINDDIERVLDGHANVTGTVAGVDLAGTVEAALRLRPQTRRVAVVTDATTMGVVYEEKLRRLESAFAGRAEFTYLRLADLAVEELLTRLSALPTDAALLVAHGSIDRTGQSLSPEESMALFARHAPVPMFVVSEARLGLGAVGGKVVSGFAQGEAAARMLLAVLRGRSADAVPILRENFRRLVFEHPQLTRWGIPDDALPAGSIVLDRPVSLWETHRTPILILAGIVMGLCGIIGVLLANIAARRRAQAALRARTAQLEALRAVSAEITRELDLTVLLALVSRRVGELVGAATGTVYLWDEAAQLLRAEVTTGPDGWEHRQTVRRGEGLVGLVADRREGMQVDDYRRWEHALPEVVERTRVTAALAEPLLYRERLVGVISLDNRTTGRPFTAQEGEILRLFAAQAAIAIENARLFRDGQTWAHQLDTIRAIGAEMTRELELRPLLTLIAERAKELTRPAFCLVFLWDEKEQVLVPHAVSHVNSDWLWSIRLRLGEGVSGEAARRRVGLYVPEYATSPYADPRLRDRIPQGAAVAEPLLHGDRLLGVLVLSYEERGRVFDAAERHLVRLLADHAGIAIENARLFAALHASYQDLLRVQEGQRRSGKLRALGQMAAGMAHDLNNTLSVILGQVELLKPEATGERARTQLARLEQASLDGAQVVRRLRDFARPQGETPLAGVDLADIVAEAVALTRPRWKEEPRQRGVPITVDTALEGLPPILGNSAELREALTNLIFNAVDAMPQGGTLRLAGRHTSAGVVLTISDTGMGMSEEVRERIFEPFFTTKGAQGTGLGLAVVYGVMERHGGHIAVTSTPGAGTTFVLTFQAAEPKAERAGPVSGPAPTATFRLLLIDDEPMVRETLAALLRIAGHTVVEADCGGQGLAQLEAQPFDCVLTDLGMPDITGWQVARAVKGGAPACPVILLTGWAEQASHDPGAERYVDRVLTKPVRLEQLQQAIAEVANRAPAGVA